MKTAVSVTYNGQYSGGVFDSVDRALHHVAKLHLNGLYGMNIDVDGEILGWESEHSLPSASMDALNLAHLLALEVTDQESIELTIHNLETEPGFDTALVSFDVMDPMDPNFALVAALENARSGMEADEAAQRLGERVSQIIESFWIKTAEKTCETLFQMQHHFGYPAGSRRNLLPDEPISSGHKAFLDGLPHLAVERFFELLPLYAPTADKPAP